MTARDYTIIERMLERAEVLTLEHPPQTREGSQLQNEIRSLLWKVTKLRIRAEHRENSRPKGTK